MSFLASLYHSPWGRLMSTVAHGWARLQKPFMVYGYRDPASGSFRKYTRMSSSVTIMGKNGLTIGDHVWVGHHSILDATGGLVIEEGCQLAMRVMVFTHGSENAIRLLGRQFVHIPYTKRKGYTRGSVEIGPYSYLGSGSIVLPGVTIGKGCLIGASSLITQDVLDYSIVVGQPGKVVGSTLDLDRGFFREDDFSATYYDSQALALIKQKLAQDQKQEA